MFRRFEIEHATRAEIGFGPHQVRWTSLRSRVALITSETLDFIVDMRANPNLSCTIPLRVCQTVSCEVMIQNHLICKTWSHFVHRDHGELSDLRLDSLLQINHNGKMKCDSQCVARRRKQIETKFTSLDNNTMHTEPRMARRGTPLRG